MGRLSAILTALILGAIAISADPTAAATLSLVGPSTKLCQLTGDVDWASNQPTAALTLTHSGLKAVDLGFPVDSDPGALYFLFGDAFPLNHLDGDTVVPDDAIGWTSRTATPDAATCLDLHLASPFAHPTVVPHIKQGSFNVPSGGVFVDGTLYAFFWTDHCVVPNMLPPMPDAPLRAPAFNPANPGCPENPELNSVGRSAFARATPTHPAAFTPTQPQPILLPPKFGGMPSGFVYVSAVSATIVAKSSSFPFKPVKQATVAIFGVARYRSSIPYLALAAPAKFGDPQSWVFYAGQSGGAPLWITRAQWESKHNPSGDWVPPTAAEIYKAGSTNGGRCVGEHQVTWNAPLHTWLLLYNCGVERIEARTAPQPWGPWSAPTRLIAKTDPGVDCVLLMRNPLCLGLENYWPSFVPALQAGELYAPFVLSRYTQDATVPGGPPRATIYWLLSTWNPYQVTVMHSTLQMTP